MVLVWLGIEVTFIIRMSIALTLSYDVIILFLACISIFSKTQNI